MKSKYEEQEFKIGNLVRGFEAVKNNSLSYGGKGGSHFEGASSLLNLAELETEVKLLRGQLMDERSKREQLFFEQHQLVTQLQQ